MPTTQQRKQLFSSNRIRTGDALLVKSKSGWISQLLAYLSGSSFVHAAIAVRIDQHLYVVECKYSNRHSYQMMPIDWWLARNAEDQLFIGKMPKKCQQRQARKEVRETVMNTLESLRCYKISWLAALYILRTWFGRGRPQFKRIFTKNKPLICSTLVQEAWERAGVIPERAYMTPGELVDMLGGESALAPIYEQRLVKREINLEACNDPSPAPKQLAHA